MHGTITGTFKNQIDWIPLNTGSVSIAIIVASNDSVETILFSWLTTAGLFTRA